MIRHSPLPERPQSLDEACDRGFDRDSLVHDLATPEPLTAEWQTHLDAAVAQAKALRAEAVAS